MKHDLNGRILLTILFISFSFEFIFSVVGFISPVWTLEQFSISATNDTLFLGFVISWLLLFVAIACFLSFWQIYNTLTRNNTLANILGIWWVAIGIGIYFKSGRVDNLFLDSLKGAAILFFNLRK